MFVRGFIQDVLGQDNAGAPFRRRLNAHMSKSLSEFSSTKALVGLAVLVGLRVAMYPPAVPGKCRLRPRQLRESGAFVLDSGYFERPVVTVDDLEALNNSSELVDTLGALCPVSAAAGFSLRLGQRKTSFRCLLTSPCVGVVPYKHKVDEFQSRCIFPLVADICYQGKKMPWLPDERSVVISPLDTVRRKCLNVQSASLPGEGRSRISAQVQVPKGGSCRSQ